MISKTKNLIIRNFQEKDAVGLLEYLSIHVLIALLTIVCIQRNLRWLYIQ